VASSLAFLRKERPPSHENNETIWQTEVLIQPGEGRLGPTGLETYRKNKKLVEPQNLQCQALVPERERRSWRLTLEERTNWRGSGVQGCIRSLHCSARGTAIDAFKKKIQKNPRPPLGTVREAYNHEKGAPLSFKKQKSTCEGKPEELRNVGTEDSQGRKNPVPH